MASWGAQRQALIILVFLILAVGSFSFFYFVYFRSEPTCFDGYQNQGELGVDCGRPCAKVCRSEVSPLVTFWSRVFFVDDGIYDVAALIENPNAGYGIGKLAYKFKAYDKNNVLVVERSGTTFVNEKDRFVIFEPRLAVGNRVPTRAILEFEELAWERFSDRPSGVPKAARFAVQEKELSLDPRPRLSADIINNSSLPLRNVEVAAVVLDEAGNALGVSSTIIDALPRSAEDRVVFTWPRAFDAVPVATEIYPRANVVTP